MPGQKEVALYIESPPMPTRMSWSMLGMDRLENLERKRPLEEGFTQPRASEVNGSRYGRLLLVGSRVVASLQ